MSGDGGGGGHRGADQMGAAARTLTPLEITIGCACAPLSRLQDILVHPKTHAAA
ncbi:uncharacterized protein METZ01_LOCUS187951, partial [marine metagenome]